MRGKRLTVKEFSCDSFLQQVIDDLLPVLAVGAERDVNPVAPFGVVLHDELVEDDVRLYPIKPPLPFDSVAVDAQVSRFAVHVLAVADTTNCCVELRATVAATYLYLMPHRVA